MAGGAPQTEGDVSREAMRHACDELEMLLARAQSVLQKMESRAIDTLRAKKVGARERGYDAYTAFLDGVEKAVLYPPEALPEPTRKPKRKG